MVQGSLHILEGRYGDQLSGMILGKTITIALPEGAVVEGETISVTSSSLTLDVKKTSDPARHPAGRTSLPRPSISEVRMIAAHGNGGRVLGSVLGVLIGTIAGSEIAGHALRGEGPVVGTITGVAVAASVARRCAARLSSCSSSPRWSSVW